MASSCRILAEKHAFAERSRFERLAELRSAIMAHLIPSRDPARSFVLWTYSEKHGMAFAAATTAASVHGLGMLYVESHTKRTRKYPAKRQPPRIEGKRASTTTSAVLGDRGRDWREREKERVTYASRCSLSYRLICLSVDFGYCCSFASVFRACEAK